MTDDLQTAIARALIRERLDLNAAALSDEPSHSRPASAPTPDRCPMCGGKWKMRDVRNGPCLNPWHTEEYNQ